MRNNYFLKLVLIALTTLSVLSALADTPVDLFQSYAGNINFVGTEATRRDKSNNGTGTDPACSVLGDTTPNYATVTGIPTGSNIKAAHLYWAGSGSTADYNVTFEGGPVSAPANRRYTANYNSGTTNYTFFSGVADVTAQVNTERNGTYSFSDLTVHTGAPHCGVEGVLAGWSLVIIYEAPSEDFRVINLFEGFQAFRNSSITLNPNNFKTPSNPADVNGKHATITWEGDNTLNSTNENIVFNGNNLADGNNPQGGQFNSLSNITAISPSTGSVNTTSYGVDFDAFDITSFLSTNQTSATSTYSSGSDLVLLSSEIISVTNTEVSDLSVTKTATSIFNVGSNATYNIEVHNAGPNDEPGTITVTDTLPTGLSYVSAAGTGWSCGVTGVTVQTVTCNLSGGLAVGSSASPITLTVTVATTASSVSNTATVSGTNFDNVSSNNNSTAVVPVNIISGITLLKELTDESKNNDSLGEKKEELTYTITLTNSGSTDETITIEERVPAGTKFVDGNDFDTATCVKNAPAGTVCSKTSPVVPAGGSIDMIFVVKVLDPVSTTSIDNYVIEAGDTPPICNTGESSDPRCVSIGTTLAQPNISLQKTTVTLYDPVNLDNNPKAIPGATAEYSITATNSGNAAADSNTIIISDSIPTNTALYVGAITGWDGPILFTEGSSGLTYDFISLSNDTDNLGFSQNGGLDNYLYHPTADAEGVDTSVTHIRISPLGQFLAPSGAGNPSFQLKFRVKVQ